MASEKDTHGATDDCENREEESGQGQLLPSLPPTDNGPEAWKYLIACFVVEALLWGTPKFNFHLLFAIKLTGHKLTGLLFRCFQAFRSVLGSFKITTPDSPSLKATVTSLLLVPLLPASIFSALLLQLQLLRDSGASSVTWWSLDPLSVFYLF
jgi:hypothetical protein